MNEEEWRPEIAEQLRTTYRPVVEQRPGALGASKFGGQPWLAADESWPTCPNCERPLHLFVQLDLATLPSSERERLGETGLLQLFYCTSSKPLCELDCEAYLPFSPCVVARWIEDVSQPSRSDVVGPEDPFEPQIITGWEPQPDLPAGEEFEFGLGIPLDDAEWEALRDEGLPVRGDKLGGWPAWVQGVEYPPCRICSGAMVYVFQVASNEHVDHMFGDLGTGHLTRCPEHSHVVAFAWACH